jgi:hypothetical protein
MLDQHSDGEQKSLSPVFGGSALSLLAIALENERQGVGLRTTVWPRWRSISTVPRGCGGIRYSASRALHRLHSQSDQC